MDGPAQEVLNNPKEYKSLLNKAKQTNNTAKRSKTKHEANTLSI
jgi:hypothetical protein